MKYSILVIAIFVISCFSKEPEIQKTGLEGKLLPDFNLQLPDSISYHNSQNIDKDKPLAIFYFSPFCPYCRAQTTEIIEDMDRLKDIQFYFITAFPYHNMRQFYDEYQLSKYPNIIIGVDTAQFVGNYFEVPGVPYMAIYNKERKFSSAFIGKVYSSQIIKAVKF